MFLVFGIGKQLQLSENYQSRHLKMRQLAHQQLTVWKQMPIEDFEIHLLLLQVILNC